MKFSLIFQKREYSENYMLAQISCFEVLHRSRFGFHRLPQGSDTDAYSSTLGHPILLHDPHPGLGLPVCVFGGFYNCDD